MPFGCKAPSSLAFSFLSLQLGFDLDREVYPLVVHAVVDEGDGTVLPVFWAARGPVCGRQAGSNCGLRSTRLLRGHQFPHPSTSLLLPASSGTDSPTG